jgi:hypothetical protein
MGEGGRGKRRDDPVAYGALAATARQRCAAEVPAEAAFPVGDEKDIRHEPWWRVRTLRRLTLRGAFSLGGMLALSFLAANTLPWWYDAVRVTEGPTAVARARVGDVDGVVLPWLLPDSVQVAFRTLDGHLVRTAVAHVGHRPRRGSVLRVEYALRSPTHAEAAGNAGLPWGVSASGGLAALCLTRIVWRATAAGRSTRDLVRAARHPEAEPRRYVLLREPEDPGAWLVFFPVPGRPADRPHHLVHVRAAAFAPVGIADVRGDPRDGGTVVPWLEGHAAWPTTPLSAFGPEEERFVLRLLSGDAGDHPQHA